MTRLWASIRQRLATRLGLPAKLAATTMLIAAAGLVIMGAASLVVARSYLIRNVDSELRIYAEGLVTGGIKLTPSGGVAAGPLGSGLAPGPVPGLVPGPAGQDSPGIEVLGPSGALLTPLVHPPIPAAPAYLASISTRAATPVNVPAGSGSASWRVIAEPIHYQARHILFVYGEEDFSLSVTSPAKPGLPGILVVGINPGRTRSVGRIAAAVLVVAAVMIVLLTCAVAVLTRVGLRPLTRIERTAGAVARGEPWRPEPSLDPGGHEGSLAQSLNTTLAHAERSLSVSTAAAAASQQATERIRMAMTDACLQARAPLRIIHGLAVSWRRRGTVRPDDLDRMMKRVDEEAARIGSLVDDLASQGRQVDDLPDQGGAAGSLGAPRQATANLDHQHKPGR